MASKIFFLTTMILVGVASRVLPHLPNFTPLGAMALFSGFYFKNKNYALLPLIVLALSDLIISGYYGPVMFYVYGGFLLTFIIGRAVSTHQSPFPKIFISSLTAAVLFFVITNFAVWLHTNLYTKDLPGLIASYIAAIPFFRSSLLGDLTFTTVFFGAYEAARRLSLQQQKTASRRGSTGIPH